MQRDLSRQHVEESRGDGSEVGPFSFNREEADLEIQLLQHGAGPLGRAP